MWEMKNVNPTEASGDGSSVRFTNNDQRMLLSPFSHFSTKIKFQFPSMCGLFSQKRKKERTLQKVDT